MLYVKAFHIIFVVTWFAGLFYLPRLFVYHAMTSEREGVERFKVMERKLYRGIMTPSALLAIGFGSWLWLGFGITGAWLHAKLVVVLLLVGYHAWCGRIVATFASGSNARSHVWYRWFNEVPVLLLIIAVVLAVVKPF
jgi:putative membrane protein